MTKLSFSLASACAFTFATILISNNPAHSQGANFSCDSSTGVPATVVESPQHGKVRIIDWKTTEFGDGFDPQSRCNIVSEKFQKYSQAGTLKYFTTGSVDRNPVICAVASESMSCSQENMLYTLKRGSNASETLKQLLDVRSGATGSALNETGSRVYVDFDEVVEAKAQNAGASSESKANSEANSEAAPLF
jgi:hypothetical protein